MFRINFDNILFHYTSHTALHSIVENKTIRLTHAYYLNDSNEILFAIRSFELLLDSHHKKERSLKRADFIIKLKEWLGGFKDNAHYIFVFSLSKHINLLSQWRAYTPHGSGISFGFEVESLKKWCERKDLDLVECIYTREEREKVLNDEILRIFALYDSKFSIFDENFVSSNCEYLDFMNSLAEPLLKLFCRIKDPAFKEEGEWRLISNYYQYYSHTDIKFRPGKTTLVPFIEKDICDMREDGYLFEVSYVGPSPNFNLSFQAIEAFMSNKRACKETYSSQSAFREL